MALKRYRKRIKHFFQQHIELQSNMTLLESLVNDFIAELEYETTSDVKVNAFLIASSGVNINIGCMVVVEYEMVVI